MGRVDIHTFYVHMLLDFDKEPTCFWNSWAWNTAGIAEVLGSHMCGEENELSSNQVMEGMADHQGRQTNGQTVTHMGPQACNTSLQNKKWYSSNFYLFHLKEYRDD